MTPAVDIRVASEAAVAPAPRSEARDPARLACAVTRGHYGETPCWTAVPTQTWTPCPACAAVAAWHAAELAAGAA